MESEYTEESTPKGRKTKKIVKTTKSLGVELAVVREINNMLGYSYDTEKRVGGATAQGKQIVRVKDEE